MDLLWMLPLLVVLVHSEAEKVTEVRGELGQDVALTCSFKFCNIYWYMEIHNRIKAQIGHIYSSTEPPFYPSPDFETKYLVVENRLEIKNFSSDDCRLYFCGRKKDGTMVYGDTIRLVSDVSVAPPTDVPPLDVPDCESQKVTIIIYRSALIILLLLFLTAGLGSTCWRTRIQKVQTAAVDPENNETQQTAV